MQHMNISLVSSHDASLDYVVTTQIIQQKQTVHGKLITCPHCGTPSLPAGKVNNGWYSLCPCGTYIQTCTSDAAYAD